MVNKTRKIKALSSVLIVYEDFFLEELSKLYKQSSKPDEDKAHISTQIADFRAALESLESV